MMPDKKDRLEEELRELGRDVEFPPTPDLSRRVRSRIEDDENRGSGGAWLRLPSARWAVAAAVFLVVISPFLSPAFRGAVSEFSTFGGASSEGASSGGGEASPTLSSESPPSSKAPSSEEDEAPTADVSPDLPDSAAGGEVGITPEEARERSGVEVPFLPALGEPDEVRARGPDGFSLVYENPPANLTVRPGEDFEAAFPAARRPKSESASVDGGRARWLPPGTLFWEKDGTAFRLRSDFSKSEAVRLADSAR